MNKNERPLGELFTELTGELRTLVQEEMELARTEISEKATRFLKDIAAVVVGGVLAYTGFLVLIAAAVLAFGMAVQLWASALIIGAVLAAAGFIFINKARKDMARGDMMPEKTAETVKETAKWAKAQMK